MKDKILFEWDANKNRINQQKHQVSFTEAESVFYDENAILFDDPDHSLEEERFLLLGYSVLARLLIVCHCYRDKNGSIRIISARKATRTETETYTDFNGGVF